LKIMLRKEAANQVAIISLASDKKIWVEFENELKSPRLYNVEDIRAMFKLYVTFK